MPASIWHVQVYEDVASSGLGLWHILIRGQLLRHLKRLLRETAIRQSPGDQSAGDAAWSGQAFGSLPAVTLE